MKFIAVVALIVAKRVPIWGQTHLIARKSVATGVFVWMVIIETLLEFVFIKIIVNYFLVSLDSILLFMKIQYNINFKKILGFEYFGLLERKKIS
jgi:hypothetical protein